MPKKLKKNTAILQVPEKVINDKNNLVKSTTKKGNLKKDTLKIKTGDNLKIISKGEKVEPKAPKPKKEVKPKIPKEPKPKKEVKPKEPKPKKDVKPKTPKVIEEVNEKADDFIMKPLTEKELKESFNHEAYGNVDSVEKFNLLNFEDKWWIEYNVNNDILNGREQDYINEYFDSTGEYNDNKFQKAIDKYGAKFQKIISKLRKKSKTDFLDFLKSNDPGGFLYRKKYRFIF